MNYLLIWDIDGTLIRTKGVGKRAMNTAFYKLFGIEDGFGPINMAGMLDAIIVRKAFEIHNIPVALPDGRENTDIERFYELYIEALSAEISMIQGSIACPGVLELLETLHRKDNFYNVLGTGNIEAGARLKLSVDNMNRYFPTGSFGNRQIERYQLIEEAIANSEEYFKMTFQRDKIFVIGDTPKDVECGNKLGIKSIGVATGNYNKKQLSEHGADYVFENFSDITSFLEIF
ncbi:MAG TPA: HAD hydrolase-like protein [Clostridiaceae bacterium]|nr:HAD hydrolase-like protein [Clostridiaceae bacterium]